jgi:hypothetical protein
LYLGEPRFKSRPGDVYPDWGFSFFSSVAPGIRQDTTLKLGRDSFFPIYHSLTILTFYSSIISAYFILIVQSSLK